MDTNLPYKIEKASQGLPMKPQKTDSNRYTTVRIQPTKVQMWQAIQLVQALGGKPEGKSWQWIVQVLFDSLIQTNIQSGKISHISHEDAEKELRKWKEDTLPQGASIERLEQIKQIEQETEAPKNPAAEFSDDLEKAAQEQDMEGIGDLFDFSEFQVP